MHLKTRQYFISFLRICLILGLLYPGVNYAQNRKTALREDVQRLEEEIAYTNNLLATTRQNRSTSLEELLLLNKKIEQRGKLIIAIDAEIIELMGLGYPADEIRGKKRMRNEEIIALLCFINSSSSVVSTFGRTAS